MQKAHDSQLNNYWQNLPSIETPIVAGQLNRNEQTVDLIDDRVCIMDTDKANQSDMLLAVKTITFDSATGTFTITLFNGTSTTINTDIEKIPINFDYDDDPESANYQKLIIELDDGTYKYIDMSALVTEYDFATTDTISATVLGGIVSMDVVNGSITDEKIQPHYLADVTAQASASADAATAASGSRVDAEAWAVGTRNGTPVQMGDPAFQNNSKYYAEHGAGTSFQGLSDTDFNNLENGQVAVYDSVTTKWVNTTPDTGMSARIVINADAGSTVSITTPGGETITPEVVTSTVWKADVTEYGTYSVTAISSGVTRTQSVLVDTVKIYTITISGQASITFTTGIASDLKVTVGATEITTFPATITVSPSEVSVAYSYGSLLSLNANWVQTLIISPNETKTVNVVVPGDSLGPTNDVQGWLMCAEIYDKNYTTVSQVIADSTTLNALIADENAVKYMKRSTGFASDICGSSTAMTAIGLDNDCSNALLLDSTWLAAICGSTYFESVLNVKVPTMTGNTTPSGECIGDSRYSSDTYTYFKAFDNNGATYWVSNTNSTSGQWIGYGFAASEKILKATLTATSATVCQSKIQYSEDGSSWTDSGVTFSVSSADGTKAVIIGDVGTHKYWRTYCTGANASNMYGLYEVQFYGRKDV